MRPGSFGHSVQTMISPPNRWRLVKSVLFFGIACGILGATIGSAFQALNRSQACGDDRGRSAGHHWLVSTGLVRVPFRICEQAPIWSDARSCPGIARGRSDWVGLRVDCSDFAMELGGCPHRGYPGLDPDCSTPTFPQALLWDCAGNLWRDSRPGFPKGPKPRSGRRNQWLAHRVLCGDRGFVGIDLCAEPDAEDAHGMGAVA